MILYNDKEKMAKKVSSAEILLQVRDLIAQIGPCGISDWMEVMSQKDKIFDLLDPLIWKDVFHKNDLLSD